jgi:hypothetical protein
MQQQATEQQPKVRRERSPVERGLVWGVILALYLVVVFEWRAQYGYNQALPALSDAIEKAENEDTQLKVDDAVRIMKKEPEDPVSGKYGIADVWFYTWRWRSLFKSYAIKLTVDKQEKSVLLLETED